MKWNSEASVAAMATVEKVRVMKRVFYRLVAVSCCGLFAGCLVQQPPRKRTIEAPTLSCQEANQLSYRTVLALDFSVVSFETASPGHPGRILARKDGRPDGIVTITCTESGAVVEPEKTGLPIPALDSRAERPNEFPQIFLKSFNILRMQQDYAVQKGPEKGLTLTMTRLNSYESRIELGVDLPASGVLPVKVVISNNTARPYGLDAAKVYLMAEGGGRVTPSPAPAAGQGKALQGDITIQPGQTLSGYLFYPAGNYASARTTLVDKESDEGEGFSVQF
jgi:hypothetical protein